jgi:hypothetical protein
VTDMLETIVPKSDQINADDLIGGRSLTITVTKVDIKMDEQPVTIHFEGDGGKPYRPGKSMRRVLVNVWGPDANAYVGRSMTLYRDDKVVFGGVAVGGLRISHMSHMDHEVTMALTATRAIRKPFVVKPLAKTRPETAATPRAGGWAPLNADGGVPIDPLDEENGTKWLTNLGTVLAQAGSFAEIAEIEGHPSVAKARANATSLIKERIADMVQKARGRFTTEDAPVENAPEHEPVSEVAAFRERVETMSLQQLQRLDTNAEHKAWLKGLTPPDYADAAAAITGRLQALRGGA